MHTDAGSRVTAAGLTESLSWNAALSLTQDTKPNNESTSIYYTSGLMNQTVSATGATTTRTYKGNVVMTTVSGDGLQGRWTRQTLDGFGRTILTESGSATAQSAVKTEYAPCACSPTGKVWRVSMPYDPNSPPAQFAYTTYEYDGLGRTTKVTGPDGSATRYVYDGNTVTVTDARQNWKKYTMDAFGQLTNVEEPEPSGANSTWTTSYTYDVAGRLIRVDMPRPVSGGTYTQTRTFNYKTNGQIGPWLVSATNPENGTVRYEYFADGRLAARTDNAGVRTTYAYDQVGLTGISYDGTVAATFERGTAAEHAAGRVKNVRYSTDRHSVVETYTYDVYGRATAKQMGLTGNYVVNGQTYNGDRGGPVELRPGGPIAVGDGSRRAAVYVDVQQHGAAGHDADASGPERDVALQLDLGTDRRGSARHLRFFGRAGAVVAGVAASAPDGHSTLVLGDDRLGKRIFVGALDSSDTSEARAVTEWGIQLMKPGTHLPMATMLANDPRSTVWMPVWRTGIPSV